MIKAALKELFTRDLKRLKKEIESYQDDSNLWKTEKSIQNSGGNLCLHLIGNLKTYIGNGLAGKTYVRQREYEFSAKNVEREKMYVEIDETIAVVNQGLDQLNDEQLAGIFPIVIWEKERETVYTLLHLQGHLNYHLGQISYHRRLLEGKLVEG